MEFNSGKPKISALYYVDRGAQGKAYRWYDADTDQWGRCGFDMQTALDNRSDTAVGFFPWVGPLTGTKFNPNKRIDMVSEETSGKVMDSMADALTGKTKVAKAPKAPAKKMARQSGKTLVTNAPKASGKKQVYADGTIFFRADRQKWVAVMNGKQEAARPTIEACKNFLFKKYSLADQQITVIQ